MPERLCPHFGTCGGCHSQDVAYEQQLADKAAMLASLFAQAWPGPIPIDGSPRVWHYRNKVEFSFDRKFYEQPPPPDFVRETVLGFRQSGRWNRTLDLETCLIAPEGTAELLAAVRAWMRREGLQSQYGRHREGTLRHLVVRHARRTGEKMVILSTADAPVNEASFVQTVAESFGAHSIYRSIYRGTADAVKADELHLLAGQPEITERLHIPDGDGERRLDFKITPLAFFQTNPLATEILYGHLRRWIARLAPPLLLDLYGGSGGIAFTCADLVPRVVSVEEVAPATEDGRRNAALNGIGNVDFVTADVRRWLEAYRNAPETWPAAATVILDPPRAGLHPKVISHLLTLLPPRLLYVSCNPKLLAQELPRFLEFYRLTELRAVDLFPHTPHVECLALLERRAESPPVTME